MLHIFVTKSTRVELNTQVQDFELRDEKVEFLENNLTWVLGFTCLLVC